MEAMTTGKHEADSGEGALGTVQAKVGDAADQAKQKMGLQVRDQLDTRSSQAGQQAKAMADAIRRSAEELRTQGQEGPARLVEQAAGKVEGLSTYLASSDSDKILRDVEAFARKQPLVVAAGAAALGFVAARFLGASSRRRGQPSSLSGSAGFSTPAPLPDAARAPRMGSMGELVDLRPDPGL